MEAYIDLYQALRDLIDQIPEGMFSTPLDLADALGDRRAVRAVSEAIQREEFRDAAPKVVRRPVSVEDVFREFSSDRPLRRLRELQKTMSKQVVQEDKQGATKLVAGVDAAYGDDEAYAVCVVLDRQLEVVDSASVTVNIRFPYIPGYLSFREAPVIEAAAGNVSGFDILLVNGHGIAHPRGCGLASHVGLDLGVATIGVARRGLVRRVGAAEDGWAPLIYKNSVVGAALTIDGRSPVYVSIGHNISLQTSVRIVQRTTRGGRLPEPLRMAHRAAEEFRRQGVPGSA